jgi:hypothetical protein
MITHESWTSIKDTKDTTEAPFDAKTILPESKALKPISKLLESMKKVVRFPDLRSTFVDLYRQSESRSLTFACIDGTSRTYPAPHGVNLSIASTSTHSEPEPPSTQAVPNLELSATRTGFKAFGIEVCPYIILNMNFL